MRSGCSQKSVVWRDWDHLAEKFKQKSTLHESWTTGINHYLSDLTVSHCHSTLRTDIFLLIVFCNAQHRKGGAAVSERL